MAMLISIQGGKSEKDRNIEAILESSTFIPFEFDSNSQFIAQVPPSKAREVDRELGADLERRPSQQETATIPSWQKRNEMLERVVRG